MHNQHSISWRLTAALLLALILAAPAAAWAGFEDGAAAYEQGDYATALREWTPLAEGGNQQAQYNIGYMHFNGIGVAKAPAEAARWFTMAATQGEAAAQMSLGVMYGTGQGVPQDYSTAYIWLTLAAARLPYGEDRNHAIKNRDIVSSKMSRAQITEALGQALNWTPKTQDGAPARTTSSVGSLVPKAPAGAAPRVPSVPSAPATVATTAPTETTVESTANATGPGSQIAAIPKPKPPEAKAPEAMAPEAKTPEVKAPEVKAPEVKEPDVMAPEVKAPEVAPPVAKAPEAKAPEVAPPVAKAPEVVEPPVKAPEGMAAEAKAPEPEAPEPEAPAPQRIDTAAAPPTTAAPAATSTPPEPSSPRSAALTTGAGYLVQLAALRTMAAAQDEWLRLRRRHTAVIGAMTPVMQAIDLGSRGTFVRIHVGPFADKESARELCQALQAQEQDCVVVLAKGRV